MTSKVLGFIVVIVLGVAFALILRVPVLLIPVFVSFCLVRFYRTKMS